MKALGNVDRVVISFRRQTETPPSLIGAGHYISQQSGTTDPIAFSIKKNVCSPPASRKLAPNP